MPSLYIALAPGVARAGTVVPHSRPRISGEVEITVTSAILQFGSNDIEGVDGEFWFLTARGGDAVIAVGDDPEAGVDPGHLCPAGVPMAFPVNKVGEKIAGISA